MRNYKRIQVYVNFCLSLLYCFVMISFLFFSSLFIYYFVLFYFIYRSDYSSFM